jgi:uncharacterized protein YjiS (DUF1127 family)
MLQCNNKGNDGAVIFKMEADLAHYRTTHRASSVPEAWIERLADAWRRYRGYTSMLAELQSLSDRELADVGIARFAIRDVAHEAAYGPAAR